MRLLHAAPAAVESLREPNLPISRWNSRQKFEFIINLKTGEAGRPDNSIGGARPREQADQVSEENEAATPGLN
jgi:hypothetical protein